MSAVTGWHICHQDRELEPSGGSASVTVKDVDIEVMNIIICSFMFRHEVSKPELSFDSCFIPLSATLLGAL